jgi:hypothetical protein
VEALVRGVELSKTEPTECIAEKVIMERPSVLPYDWFNRTVMVEAYSGEERSLSTDEEGISGVSHVMVRKYVGQLVNADPAGLLLVLRGERMLFLSASSILSVEPVEPSAEE